MGGQSEQRSTCAKRTALPAAGAAGSVLACPSSVIWVVGARGIARCDGAAPMGHMEGCEWLIS